MMDNPIKIWMITRGYPILGNPHFTLLQVTRGPPMAILSCVIHQGMPPLSPLEGAATGEGAAGAGSRGDAGTYTGGVRTGAGVGAGGGGAVSTGSCLGRNIGKISWKSATMVVFCRD